jgi:hypothetical protein
MGYGNAHRTFEKALRSAEETLLLTGTMTDLQKKTIAECVASAIGSTRMNEFAVYDFPSIKRVPLQLRDLGTFRSDFIRLFETLKFMHENRIPLPRITFILPESKLDVYRNLLAGYALSDQAHVVSRKENLQAEIEAARRADKPILIASPLFSIGLNALEEPQQLWCHFSRIDVDTSRIIQTVNRANRGNRRCAVRVYVGALNPKDKWTSVKQLRADVVDILQRESSLRGVLEEHFTIDRVTYTQLRKVEKNTAQAFHDLISNDAFENYRIMDLRKRRKADKDNEEVFKAASKAARAGYQADIHVQATRFNGLARDWVFMQLDNLAQERRTFDRGLDRRTEKEIKDEELGLVMNLVGTSDTRLAQDVNIKSMKVLFAEHLPYATEQYDPEQFPKWSQVRAEKSEALVEVAAALNLLRLGRTDGFTLARSLTRSKKLKDGFLALCRSEASFVETGKKFQELEKARKKARENGTDQNKADAMGKALGLLGDLLKRIGVYFEDVPDSRPKQIDWTKPVVPGHWNFEDMTYQIQLQAEMLKKLPEDRKRINTNYDPPETDLELPQITPVKLCRGCVFLRHGYCAAGNYIDWTEVGIETLGERVSKCQEFKKAKVGVKKTHEFPKTGASKNENKYVETDT